MVEFKRSIRCSNCGVETNFHLSSEITLNELLIHGSCSSCGNSLQLNFNIVEKEVRKEEKAEDENADREVSVNFDDSLNLNETESTSDVIRNLMGN